MKIIIRGDFFDCQIIRDRFFIWDSWGTIRVFDFRQQIDSALKTALNVELAFEDVINLHNAITAKTRMPGGIFPNDSVFVNNFLYYATESGVFRVSIGYGKEFFEFSTTKPQKMTGIQVLDLSAGPEKLIAMAAGQEGVFEIYDPKSIRVTKSGHDVKDIDKGVYQVSGSTSYNVSYQDRNIQSVDQFGRTRLLTFGSGDKWTKRNGKLLRPYIRSEYPKEAPLKLYPIGNQVIESVEKPVVSAHGDAYYSFCLERTPNLWVPIAGKLRSVTEASFGTVVEAREEVVIQRPNNTIKRIGGPITRTRVQSGFGGKDNLLMVVLGDRIEIMDNLAINTI